MNISGMVLGLIGGLGLFLYGMTLMSDSLEKAAGAKLRGILELFTKNRYVGIIVGVNSAVGNGFLCTAENLQCIWNKKVDQKSGNLSGDHAK